MKIRSLLALVGLAISFAVPTFAQQQNPPDPKLREQIVALFDKFTEAWNNNNAATLAALYTKDAVFCGGEGSGPHYGREAIEKHYCPVISHTASAGYDHWFHSFRTVPL